jgi:hypothetical protein
MPALSAIKPSGTTNCPDKRKLSAPESERIDLARVTRYRGSPKRRNLGELNRRVGPWTLSWRQDHWEQGLAKSQGLANVRHSEHILLTE